MFKTKNIFKILSFVIVFQIVFSSGFNHIKNRFEIMNNNTVFSANNMLGKFKIEKTDESNKFISGSEFTLTGNDNFTKTIKVENGKAEVTDLTPGVYTLKETKPPDGYIVSKNSWTINVKDDGFTTVVENKIDEKTELSEIGNMSIVRNAMPRNLLRNAMNVKLDESKLYDKTTNPDHNFEYSEKETENRDGERYKNPTKSDFYNYEGIFKGSKINVAGLNKYLSPTSTPGEYDVHLKVKGNTVKDENKIGVVIVYDNSASMQDSPNGYDSRFNVAKKATTSFIKKLLENPNVEIGLVTFAGNIYDGQNHYDNLRYTYYYYENFCHDFTKNANDLISKLPTKPADKDLPMGGTYTAKGLKKAQDFFEKRNDFDKKFIVTITDGIPTFSPTIDRISNDTATMNYEDSNRKGSGFLYPLEDISSTGQYVKPPGKPYQAYKDEHYGYVTINDNGEATRYQAQEIKNKGIEMHTVGIQIFGDAEASKEDAEKLMQDISTKPEYFYNTHNLDKLENNLLKVLNSIEQNTIKNGSVVDKMGNQVIFDKNFNNNGYKLTGYKGNQENKDITIGVEVKYDETTKNIEIKNLNLGTDEWIDLTYRVHLNIEDSSFKEKTFFKTNEIATLNPNSQHPDVKYKFPEPEILANLKEISIIKKWQNIGTEDKTAKFELQRKLKEEDDSKYIAVRNKSGEVISATTTLNSGKESIHTFKELIPFNNQGKLYEYRVIESLIPDGYDSITINDGSGINKIINREIPVIKVKNLPNNVEFTKQGVSNTPLDKVKFKLEVKENSEWKTVEEYREILSEKGKIKLEKLKIGEYRLIETEALEGYIKPDENSPVATFIVNNSGEFENIKTNSSDNRIIKNDLDAIDLKILKFEKGTSTKILQGATFELYKNNSKPDFTNPVEKITSSDGLSYWTTQNDGTVTIKGLKDGTYWLKETEAPLGYKKKDDFVGPIKIEKGIVTFEEKEIENKTIQIENERNPMKFYISKQDDKGTVIKQGTLKLKLKDVKFNGNSDEKEFNLATDYIDYEVNIDGHTEKQSGLLIEIPIDIKTAVYELTETIAPLGYQLSSEKYKIKIDQEKRTIEVLNDQNSTKQVLYKEDKDKKQILQGLPFVIKNEKAVYPSTGGPGTLMYLLVGSTIMAISLLTFRRQFKNLKTK